MEKCVLCSGNVSLVQVSQEFNVPKQTLPCVVEGILARKCEECGEIFLGSEANIYVDEQISIFKNEGIELRINAVYKELNTNLSGLSRLLGEDRQNLHRKIANPASLKLVYLCQIAYKLGIPLQNLVHYYPIVEREGKLYLNKEENFVI